MIKKDIPVVILAGGLGTRLREETEFRPKPMVPIGGKPVLWHIMKLYSHYGFYRFIICLGYKGEMIKHYFANYPKPAEMKSLPDLAWKMIIGPTGWLLHKISIATLPDSYRRKFNVPFGKGDQMFFKFFAWAVRTFYPLVPQGKRYIPLARRAFADARNHPEAYHIS